MINRFYLIVIFVSIISLLTGKRTFAVSLQDENQSKIDVLNYNLSIDLYPEVKNLIGDIVITAIKTDPILKEVTLNFYDNLKITELLFNGKEAKYTSGKKILKIFPEIITDTFKVEIKYEGTPKKAGLSGFVFGELNGSSIIYNLNEPDYASTWFPCNDIPSDKALFEMYITGDSSKTSVSNGILVDTKLNGRRKTFHWRSLYPIATYLVCIYSADYVVVEDKYVSLDGKDTMPVNYYLLRRHIVDGRKDLEDHPAYIRFLAKTFGEYPFIKEKYGVAEFLWQLGAMEHQTITGIGYNFINGRKFFTDVYIHELAHHWWGDAVSPATWNDIWLNEGFATYSEALYAEGQSGFAALQSTMLHKFDDDFRGILYEPGDYLFSNTIYDKGGWVLHMLRWETGDSTFFNILRSYYNEFKYRSASTDDFRIVCERISGKDLNHFFDQWVYKGEGSIKVEYSYSSEENGGEYILNLKLSQVPQGYELYYFPLEIKFITEDGKEEKTKIYVDSKNKDITYKTKSLVREVIFDPDNWLLAAFKQK